MYVWKNGWKEYSWSVNGRKSEMYEQLNGWITWITWITSFSDQMAWRNRIREWVTWVNWWWMNKWREFMDNIYWSDSTVTRGLDYWAVMLPKHYFPCYELSKLWMEIGVFLDRFHKKFVCRTFFPHPPTPTKIQASHKNKTIGPFFCSSLSVCLCVCLFVCVFAPRLLP